MVERINESHYDLSGFGAKASRYENNQVKSSRELKNGSVEVIFNSGTKAIFRPNSNAKITEKHDTFMKKLLYKIDGNGVSVDTSDIDMTKIDEELTQYRKKDFPIPKDPEKIEFKINGNFVGINSSHSSKIELKGDNCFLKTSDSNDDITVDGMSNIICTYNGDDNVEIEKGSGNNIYLGKGDDKVIAPKKSVANFVFHDSDGNDNIKNATDLNPYFGAFLGNLGFLGNIWGSIKSGTNSAVDYAKTLPSKFKETITTAKDGASLVGTSVKNFDPIRDKLEFERKANEEYIQNLNNYINNLENNKKK